MLIIILFAEIGTSCAGTDVMDPAPPTAINVSTSSALGQPSETGGEPASIYQEQKNLESMLDVTIEVSGESSGEDEVPEEVLLDSSTEHCDGPSTAATMADTAPEKADSITKQSESAKSNMSVNIATNSEPSGTPPVIATHSEPSGALPLGTSGDTCAIALLPQENSGAASVAIHSESGSAPVATQSEANAATGPCSRVTNSRHDGSGRRFNDNYCTGSGSNTGSGSRHTSGSTSGSGSRHMSGPSSGYGQRRRY